MGQWIDKNDKREREQDQGEGADRENLADREPTLAEVAAAVVGMAEALGGMRTIIDRFALDVANGVDSMKAAEVRHAGYYRDLRDKVERLSLEPDLGKRNRGQLEAVDQALGRHLESIVKLEREDNRIWDALAEMKNDLRILNQRVGDLESELNARGKGGKG